MEHLELGRAMISIQNEETRNEDVYCVTGPLVSELLDHKKSISRFILDHVEDPERFVVLGEGRNQQVYTKQHDAAIQLVQALNEQAGIRLEDHTVSQARRHFINLQQGERYYEGPRNGLSMEKENPEPTSL